MHVSQIRSKLKAIGYTARQVRAVWGIELISASGERT